jgi:Cytosol aminopeptidase family, N-terminal domain
MNPRITWSPVVVVIFLIGNSIAAETADVKETTYQGTDGVTIKLRMEGPYTADVPLQAVCYFRYSADGAKRMAGAPVELDKELGGVIGALRERGEFVGNPLETILIIPPRNSIKAQALLLIGLGPESELTLKLLSDVGTVAVREAARIGATRVAFAPLIRDQGNTGLDVAEVERAVTSGALLAYHTDKRMQEEKLAKPFVLEQWIVEAGPAYYDTTAVGLQHAIDEAKMVIASRPTTPYAVAK